MERSNHAVELCQHRNTATRFLMSDSHHASIDTDSDSDPDPDLVSPLIFSDTL
ncbi:MAG: hypothetical protein QM518_05380 [Verrucomicrobiota bacterium]|nr:hypothetical protein [Verrucomicrobiota bacterium]